MRVWLVRSSGFAENFEAGLGKDRPMASAPPNLELDRVFAWMSEFGAEEALRDRDPAKLSELPSTRRYWPNARHSPARRCRTRTRAQLLLDASSPRVGVTRERLQRWEGDSNMS